jgi:hypothetical protein
MLLPTDTPLAAPPGKFRRWIRSDMRVLRWVFLALYIVIVAGLTIHFISEQWHETALMLVIAAMYASQALLIFGTGTIRLCYPIRRRRLILPVLAAATMLALLVLGFLCAMWELFWLNDTNLDSQILMTSLLALSWIGWGVLLWYHVRGRPRHGVLKRLTTWLFAGSLAELLATVPAHVIVTRRPGCLVGIGTMIGIVSGLSVMLFSFGPMILLLFLRPKYRAEISAEGFPYCPACGYDLRASRERCPECGLPF